MPPPIWFQMRRHRFDADAVLSHFGILEPPVPVVQMAKEMGIRVYVVPSPSWDGQARATEEKAEIWIDSKIGPQRARFTIAHEIGHLLLHDLGVRFRDITTQRRLWDPREAEANRFAADLLMPRWMLDVYASRFPRQPSRLAGIFDVSLAAMNIRLEQLYAW